jgi:hypothetical protein
MRHVGRRVAALLAVVTILAGCSAKTPAAPPGGNSNGAGAFGTAATTPPAPTVAATPELDDGRSPVLLTTVDVAGRKVTFDLIELYLGFDAEKEWRKDHPGATEVPPLNGHYMRNNNPRLRTLPVSADVIVKVAESDPSNPRLLPYADLPKFVADGHRTFWLTVKGGTITLMEEQFFP